MHPVAPPPPPNPFPAKPRMPGTVITVLIINVLLIIGTVALMLWAGVVTVDDALRNFPRSFAASTAPVVLVSHLPLLVMLVVAPFLLAKGRGRLLIVSATGFALALPVEPTHFLTSPQWLAHKAACLVLIVIVASLLSSRSAALWFQPRAALEAPVQKDKCPAGVIVAFILLVLAAIGHVGQILLDRYLFSEEPVIDMALVEYYPVYSAVTALLMAPFLLAGRDWPRLNATGLAATIVGALVVSAGFFPGSLYLVEEDQLQNLFIQMGTMLGVGILAFIALLLLMRRTANNWFARRRAARAGRFGQVPAAGQAAPEMHQHQPYYPGNHGR